MRIECGELPETATVATSRGRHVLYRTSLQDSAWTPGAGSAVWPVTDGVEVIGPGGYTIAPPSLIVMQEGIVNRRSWASGTREVAPAPGWLEEMVSTLCENF